ncbi:MAG: TraB/GumN family protein [Clostridia bacterium]|nr:TraB/GumN family protein [Clostridia bacterium]
MKKILSLALAAALILSCAIFPALAESHPLMYKVTDKDGHSIYLLGTMHVISAETLPIAHLDEILGQVDRVIFEVSAENMEKLANGDQGEEDATQAAFAMAVEDNGLSDEVNNMIAEFMSNVYGQPVDLETIKHLSAQVLGQLMANQYMAAAGYDATGHGVDLEVYSKAKALGLKIEGAETMDEQMSAVSVEGGDAASIEKQIVEMMGNPEGFKAQLDSLINAYNTGDKDALLAFFNQEGSRSSADAGRNANFLKVAEDALKNGGRTLIAIGLYHIIAEDGLFNTLTQAGYTVEAL